MRRATYVQVIAAWPTLQQLYLRQFGNRSHVTGCEARVGMQHLGMKVPAELQVLKQLQKFSPLDARSSRHGMETIYEHEGN